MVVTSPPSQQTEAQAGCNEKPEEAPDRETTLQVPEDQTDEDADLFDWSLPLLPAMEKTTAPMSPNLLFRVGRRLDGVDGVDRFGLMEWLQLANPLIKPMLSKIKRIGCQPEMTADDKQQLRNYKQNHQRGPRNRLSGVSLFKLVLADDQAETKYRVRYATDSVSYDEVIAITYAWHESENKSDIQLGDITIQLGDEWDVGAVLDTLVELSNDNWIWMDQFSLKQSDVATATLSYTIPMIFRNVRVVAFLPYRVCNRLFTHIKNFRGNKDSDVSTALAHVLLHDLACECTDGLYGWLSRLWTWQELMLASSLRFVWGLGESKWTRREFLNELMKQNDKKQRPGEGCSVSSAWPRAKTKGRKIKNSVKRSITDLSVFEQPIAKLLSELTERNTESVINAKKTRQRSQWGIISACGSCVEQRFICPVRHELLPSTA